MEEKTNERVEFLKESVILFFNEKHDFNLTSVKKLSDLKNSIQQALSQYIRDDNYNFIISFLGDNLDLEDLIIKDRLRHHIDLSFNISIEIKFRNNPILKQDNIKLELEPIFLEYNDLCNALSLFFEDSNIKFELLFPIEYNTTLEELRFYLYLFFELFFPKNFNDFLFNVDEIGENSDLSSFTDNIFANILDLNILLDIKNNPLSEPYKKLFNLRNIDSDGSTVINSINNFMKQIFNLDITLKHRMIDILNKLRKEIYAKYNKIENNISLSFIDDKLEEQYLNSFLNTNNGNNTVPILFLIFGTHVNIFFQFNYLEDPSFDYSMNDFDSVLKYFLFLYEAKKNSINLDQSLTINNEVMNTIRLTIKSVNPVNDKPISNSKNDSVWNFHSELINNTDDEQFLSCMVFERKNSTKESSKWTYGSSFTLSDPSLNFFKKRLSSAEFSTILKYTPPFQETTKNQYLTINNSGINLKAKQSAIISNTLIENEREITINLRLVPTNMDIKLGYGYMLLNFDGLYSNKKYSGEIVLLDLLEFIKNNYYDLLINKDFSWFYDYQVNKYYWNHNLIYINTKNTLLVKFLEKWT